jgi:surface protein
MLFPKTKAELKQIIKKETRENGFDCDLNHINVSNIADMSYLFCNSNFNGDISNWDVSNVTNMQFMFCSSKFNGDISKWDVSNVENMCSMFRKSRFKQDISNWKLNPKCADYNMYKKCQSKNICKPTKNGKKYSNEDRIQIWKYIKDIFQSIRRILKIPCFF